MNTRMLGATLGVWIMMLLASACTELGSKPPVVAIRPPVAVSEPVARPMPSLLFTDKDPLYTASECIVNWWPGNGSALDLVGSRNAQVAPGATFGPGRGDAQAFTFDGEKGWVDLGAAEPSVPAGAFTFMFWYRSDKENAKNGWQYLAHCWENGGLTVAINDKGPGTYCISLGTGAGDDAGRGTKSENFYIEDMADELWHHMVMTFDGAEVCIYHNGKLVTRETWKVYTPGNVRLTLGRCVDHGTGSRPFKGQMQDVALFSKALTGGQIEAVYAVQARTSSATELTPADAARIAAGIRRGIAPLAWYAAQRLSGAGVAGADLVQFHPAPASTDAIAHWIGELDADAYRVRENASARLREIGSEAQPAVLAALWRGSNVETRLRLEKLLLDIGKPSPEVVAERLREVLLRMGGPENIDLAARTAASHARPAPRPEDTPAPPFTRRNQFGLDDISDHIDSYSDRLVGVVQAKRNR